ncbi:MAG: endonuclease Q family protein [bacterium]
MPRFIADFHIHSKYSRATSQNMDIPNITRWARIKGIDLMGTGDFTHPGWIQELKQNLRPSGNGLFTHEGISYILSAEVCTIFFKGSKTRKVHNIILAPSFEEVEKINAKLSEYGNISSDGRPIFSFSARDLVAMILEVSENSVVIPAHIWTPWFSLFGSQSGFDSISDCFGDMREYIWALETGLSSDPAMNWRLSKLDRYSLISNSDSHSPQKIGREANILNCDLDYYSIIQTLKSKDKNSFLMTVEFFPQEGKYHYDGHRKCNVVLAPKETKMSRNICPICGRKVTVGVMHRVEDLADREEGFVPQNSIPFKHLIPLNEIIADVIATGTGSKTCEKQYNSLIKGLGTEFDILLNAPMEELTRYSSTSIAQAILAVREGNVKLSPGYDGVYGKIETIKKGIAEDSPQLSLF